MIKNTLTFFIKTSFNNRTQETCLG